jgi:glycosyltransferase involved in cell wall biosynthesis
VIFSQGGTYDLLMHPRLVAWLHATRTPYRAIANFQVEHPSLNPAELAAARHALAGAEAVYFVSTRNLAVTRRHLLHPLPNAQVIRNPLRWRPADTPPWPGDGPARLATVSRLDDGKGIHLLLHALAALGADAPPWQLTIHGHGPAENSLRDIITHLGLQDRARLGGHVAGLAAIWRDHELMCSPAIDDGVPMTIPEAMLCERPVLATCVGGAEDWLRDGDTGFLCSAPTVPLLAATLQRAFASRAHWRTMGQAAAAAAKQRDRPDDFNLLLA